MKTTSFALLFGIVFLLAGVGGFVPGLSPGHIHPDVSVAASSRLAFGLFPVNVLHNLVHLAFGLWGIVAARSIASSVAYARAVAAIYAVLMVFGMIPHLDTLFGLVPLYGNDIWLHALLAVVAGYFGLVHHDRRGFADASGARS